MSQAEAGGFRSGCKQGRPCNFAPSDDLVLGDPSVLSSIYAILVCNVHRTCNYKRSTVEVDSMPLNIRVPPTGTNWCVMSLIASCAAIPPMMDDTVCSCVPAHRTISTIISS
mmetsp:Transcript_5794/g.21095  ORF Transcript_5794/g.21095 Transcript_5794/m.21095 type:complete len:112 (+) Transcript_5794:1314-1649(+)